LAGRPPARSLPPRGDGQPAHAARRRGHGARRARGAASGARRGRGHVAAARAGAGRARRGRLCPVGPARVAGPGQRGMAGGRRGPRGPRERGGAHAGTITLMARAMADRARAGATVGVRARMGAYAELSKFGIVLLVLVSAGAGFMLSAPLGVDFPWAQGLLVLAGVMLLSCGASALNQVQERRRDALMARTAARPLPSGRLSHAQGLAFALLSVVAGALVLWWGVGRTAGILGLIASAFYNGVYTPWLKVHSPFAAVPGAIPGAIPPVIGWVAGGGALTDAGAV